MTVWILLHPTFAKPCPCAGGEIHQCDLQAHVVGQSEAQTTG